MMRPRKSLSGSADGGSGTGLIGVCPRRRAVRAEPHIAGIAQMGLPEGLCRNAGL